MSNSPASEPPTWFWIVTAVTMNEKFFEPSRSAMSAIDASICRPRLASASTRWNSFFAGSCASSTIVWIPCLKLWPAFSDAATAISRSGSCSSNAFRRFLALCMTNRIGIDAPIRNAPSRKMPLRPITETRKPTASPDSRMM